MNKNIFGTALILLCALISAGSCAGSDDNSYSTTGDCIITTATLGSLVRIMHTTAADGTDSTYTVTVQGSDFPLSIDQLRASICNLDSLPVGTDVSRTVFAAFNTTGAASIKSLTTGEDTLFVSTDSTDFSQIRLITAYATDGVSRRTYAVELRVHQEWEDSTTWTLGGTSADVAALQGGRAFAADGELTAFVRTADGLRRLKAPTARPAELNATLTDNETLDVRSIQRAAGAYYALAAGQVVSSTDGLTWKSDTMQATHFTSLLAATGRIMIATDGTSFFSTTDGGRTWTQDAREEGTLPQAGLSGTVVTSEADTTQQRVYVIGTQGGKVGLWCRTLDATGRTSHPWMRLPADEDASAPCPVLDNYTLLPYDGGLLLLGEADGNLATPVISHDGGRTWTANALKRPAGASATAVCAATGEGGQVYLLLGGTGQVWYGHINRLGWREVKKAFKE